MTVYFIGAGPGDPELLTLKAQKVIARCPVCLYAGSLVPAEVVAGAPEGARVMDTAPMTLDDTHAEIVAAHGRGEDVARVHSGDPSLYGAIAEQIRRLKAEGIPYEIIPGVPAYAAAAAALGQELTVPEVAQSIILTRMSMKSTSMPPGETLENFARTRATLAIHLGIRALREIERQLIPYYGADCPVIVAYRASWPDEKYLRGTLSDIREKVRAEKITRTALILVGPALAEVKDFRDSALYDPATPHVLRPKVSVS
ncbi:precorrin-4/cobalt-precorrin-4 C11-methyltransferase [Litoreibacter ponti]|uniref:Precorrin-4/cobalt-precorrin-4 C11-methyltransferase n=1 Tax=Litoreibacter ponti TaxID=1510457 RepID=A0A2T6BN60_9RHOB|nr:precorrin-4 C(11)-methyltransferase [Litoreibacter ponti]PTX57501.1 precorrin-4/cobalt-precorrin-4 C11-methyltransferase [Litoreibacter ponti]